MSNEFSTSTDGTTYTGEKQKMELGELPCQSCGTLVSVWLPFHGCVFCPECSGSKGYFTVPDLTE